jgi:hypothetical protein
MLLDSPDKVAAIKKLVLQMNDTDDARNLITSLLEDDRTEMLRLKRDFGASLRPILGKFMLSVDKYCIACFYIFGFESKLVRVLWRFHDSTFAQIVTFLFLCIYVFYGCVLFCNILIFLSVIFLYFRHILILF